jgi:amidase
MSASDELAFLDATAQAELIRRKQLTPLELVDAAIARIERLNPALNAVITPMFELARSSAHNPLPDGPFRGVPFLLQGPARLIRWRSHGLRFLVSQGICA